MVRVFFRCNGVFLQALHDRRKLPASQGACTVGKCSITEIHNSGFRGAGFRHLSGGLSGVRCGGVPSV